MRSTYMYRDQVQKVTNWFQSWNECEQTVALFSLLRKLSPTQNKFLHQVLEQSLQESTEIQTRENQANNPVFVKSLCSESKDQAVAQLLLCLPLLRPGNTEAKMEYLNVLPRVLNHSVENGCHIEESRQLLSYSLIHPAMDSKERNRLAMWLTHLEERYAYSVHQQSVPQQHGALTPDGQVNPELITHILDKTVETNLTNATYNGNHSNGVQLTANWQQIASSNNGNDIDINSHSKSGNSGVQNQNNGNGRAITSTSAKTGLMTGHPAGLDLNYNGAGFTVDSHLPLHATLSGPAAFSNVPSTQAINTISLHAIPQHGNNNNGSSTNITTATASDGTSNLCHRKLTRSVSAIPGSHVSDWLNRHHEEMGVMHSTINPMLLEPPHAPLSPQSSISSSGSGSDGQQGHHEGTDGQQMRNTFLEEGSGMRDVPVWLKSLRLHKYSYLFQTMTYEEMMGLCEEWLKSQNVTKGARNKIILNIKKLHERQNCIRAMEKEIMESGNMKQALTELKAMMNTPLKAFTGGSTVPTSSPAPPNNNNNNQTSGDEAANTSNSMEFNSSNEGSGIEGSAGSVESVADKSPSGSDNVSSGGGHTPAGNGEGDSTTDGDLPSQITRVLGKVCTQLLVSTRPEDECFSMYLQLLDKCLMHEAFSVEQKRKLLSWRQQIQKIWHPLPQRYNIDRQRKSFGNTFPPNNMLRGQRALRGQPVLKPGQPKWTFGGRPPITIAPIGAVTGTGVPLYRTSAFPSSPFTSIIPTCTVVEQLKAPITRTHSAPIKSNQFGFALGCRPGTESSATEPEINARLDSLCLSMTEHALGGFSDVL